MVVEGVPERLWYRGNYKKVLAGGVVPVIAEAGKIFGEQRSAAIVTPSFLRAPALICESGAIRASAGTLIRVCLGNKSAN